MARSDPRLDAEDVGIARRALDGSAAEGALLSDLRAQGKLPETFRRIHGEQLLERVLGESEDLNKTPPAPEIAHAHAAALTEADKLAKAYRTAEDRPATEMRAAFQAAKETR